MKRSSTTRACICRKSHTKIIKMRAILSSLEFYRSEITGVATRGAGGIEPEPVPDEKVKEVGNAILAFVCVERGDDKSCVDGMSDEIRKMSLDNGMKTVMLTPFAHLSNNLEESKPARKALALLKKRLV